MLGDGTRGNRCRSRLGAELSGSSKLDPEDVSAWGLLNFEDVNFPHYMGWEGLHSLIQILKSDLSGGGHQGSGLFDCVIPPSWRYITINSNLRLGLLL